MFKEKKTEIQTYCESLIDCKIKNVSKFSTKETGITEIGKVMRCLKRLDPIPVIATFESFDDLKETAASSGGLAWPMS